MEAARRVVEAGPSRPALGAALVVAAAALWASLGVFGRLAFEHGISPFEVASVRAFIAFMAVLPLALLRARPLARLRVPARDLPLVIGYGIVGVGFFYFVYLLAIERLPIAVAAALLYTAPAFVVTIAWAMRWERVRLQRLVPLGLVLLGAFLVTGAFRALTHVDGLGVAAGLGSGFAYAIFTVLGKRIRRRYDVVATILFAYGVGAIVLAFVARPWTVLIEHPEALGVLLLMGLAATLVPALLFYTGVRHIDASTASMLATIEPVIAALLALAWLGEGIAAATVAGTALILTAAVLLREPVVRRPRSTCQAPPRPR
jgi:drug/metabolite transporter, DME family